LAEQKIFTAKIALVQAPSIVSGAIITEKAKTGFQNYKESLGSDFYSLEWNFSDKKVKFRYLIADLNATNGLSLLNSQLLFGMRAVIIIFDYSHPEVLAFLEKCFFEMVLNNGNIPIALLGEKGATVKTEELATITKLIDEKRSSWNLTVQTWNIDDKKTNFLPSLFDFLSQEILIRYSNSERVVTLGNFLIDLKEQLQNKLELSLLSSYLSSLSQFSTELSLEFLEILSLKQVKEVVLKQEALTGVFRLLNHLHGIAPSFSKGLIQQIPLDHWKKKLLHEEELSEIIAFFSEFQALDPERWEKFKRQTLSEDFLATMLARIWYNIKIERFWAFSFLKEFISSNKDFDHSDIEIINLISKKGFLEKITETKYFIGTLLVFLFPTASKPIISIIEQIPPRVNAIINENLQIKNSVNNPAAEPQKRVYLEIARYKKKIAMEEEFSFGLGEIELLISTINQIALEKKEAFLEELSIATLNSEIKKEQHLENIIQFLKTIETINKDFTTKHIQQNALLFVEKIRGELSLSLVYQFFECLKRIAPTEMREILNQFTLEELVQKMILYYAELDIKTLEIPNLSKIAADFGAFNEMIAIEIIQQLFFKGIPNQKVRELLVLLMEFVKTVEEGSINKGLEEALLEDVINFFIQLRLEELQNFINLLLRSFPIDRVVIKETFLALLKTEDNQQPSYEQQKLLAFILNL